MARPFNELRNKMSPEARKRAAKKAVKMMAEMPLHELRRARDMSQEELARELHIKQAAVSKLERRTDMYISTLRRAIDALGGNLEIVARFPDGEVKISQFEDVSQVDDKADDSYRKTVRA